MLEGGMWLTTLRVNPVATVNMRKALQRVAAGEGFSAAAEVHQIVELSNGDVRHAVNELQFRCQGADYVAAHRPTAT